MDCEPGNARDEVEYDGLTLIESGLLSRGILFHGGDIVAEDGLISSEQPNALVGALAADDAGTFLPQTVELLDPIVERLEACGVGVKVEGGNEREAVRITFNVPCGIPLDEVRCCLEHPLLESLS